MKQQILHNQKYNAILQQIQQSDLFQKAYQKYRNALQKMGESRERTSAIRKGMTIPTRQFKGCLASKISPPDYQYCLENYDEDPLYEK